jgi:hypothetical protein
LNFQKSSTDQQGVTGKYSLNKENLDCNLIL